MRDIQCPSGVGRNCRDVCKLPGSTINSRPMRRSASRCGRQLAPSQSGRTSLSSARKEPATSTARPRADNSGLHEFGISEVGGGQTLSWRMAWSNITLHISGSGDPTTSTLAVIPTAFSCGFVHRERSHKFNFNKPLQRSANPATATHTPVINVDDFEFTQARLTSSDGCNVRLERP